MRERRRSRRRKSGAEPTPFEEGLTGSAGVSPAYLLNLGWFHFVRLRPSPPPGSPHPGPLPKGEGDKLEITPDGNVYCFEVDPSPAFSDYEESSGQPIAGL